MSQPGPARPLRCTYNRQIVAERMTGASAGSERRDHGTAAGWRRGEQGEVGYRRSAARGFHPESGRRSTAADPSADLQGSVASRCPQPPAKAGAAQVRDVSRRGRGPLAVDEPPVARGFAASQGRSKGLMPRSPTASPLAAVREPTSTKPWTRNSHGRGSTRGPLGAEQRRYRLLPLSTTRSRNVVIVLRLRVRAMTAARRDRPRRPRQAQATAGAPCVSGGDSFTRARSRASNSADSRRAGRDRARSVLVRITRSGRRLVGEDFLEGW